jgi:hypothetical protein
MRYIAYGIALCAAVLTLAFATGYLPRDATGAHQETATVNVLQLQETSGLKTLRRQEISDEVYADLLA